MGTVGKGLAAVGLGVAVLAGLAIYDFLQIGLPTQVTFATAPDVVPRPVQSLAMARLRLLRTCPTADFASFDSTPLTFAIAGASEPNSDVARSHEVLELFLDRGCDPNARDDGMTPLQHAVLFDDPATAALLVRHGADPSLRIDRHPPRRSAGLDTLAFAESLCERDPERHCAQMREVLLAAAH